MKRTGELRILLSGMLFAMVIFCSNQTHAEYFGGFVNVQMNYLDWTSGSRYRSKAEGVEKRDFYYPELEAGAFFDWGELYAFYDWENAFANSDKRRTAFKGMLRYFLINNLYFHMHVYDNNSPGFFEQDRIYGVGYKIDWEGLVFRPYIGYHDLTSSVPTISRSMGYQVGWLFVYPFTVMDQKLSIHNWHETDFARTSIYLNNRRMGQNGALGMSWRFYKQWEAGVQYRYAYQKLGAKAYQNAWIYTIRYYFQG